MLYGLWIAGVCGPGNSLVGANAHRSNPLGRFFRSLEVGSLRGPRLKAARGAENNQQEDTGHALLLDHILGTFGVDSPEKAFPDQLLRKALGRFSRRGGPGCSRPSKAPPITRSA